MQCNRPKIKYVQNELFTKKDAGIMQRIIKKNDIEERYLNIHWVNDRNNDWYFGHSNQVVLDFQPPRFWLNIGLDLDQQEFVLLHLESE